MTQQATDPDARASSVSTRRDALARAAVVGGAAASGILASRAIAPGSATARKSPHLCAGVALRGVVGPAGDPQDSPTSTSATIVSAPQTFTSTQTFSQQSPGNHVINIEGVPGGVFDDRLVQISFGAGEFGSVPLYIQNDGGFFTPAYITISSATRRGTIVGPAGDSYMLGIVNDLELGGASIKSQASALQFHLHCQSHGANPNTQFVIDRSPVAGGSGGDAGAALHWADGQGGGLDTNLYRDAPAVLRTDGTLRADAIQIRTLRADTIAVATKAGITWLPYADGNSYLRGSIVCDAATTKSGVTLRVVRTRGQTGRLQSWDSASGMTVTAINANGQIEFTPTSSVTGKNTALLGSNCPATRPDSPRTWAKVMLSDGGQGYIPVWT